MLARWNPFSEMERLRSELDKLFDTQYTTDEGESLTAWSPRADIVEHADFYEVLIDLPGMEPGDVRVTVEDGTLSIAGTREIVKFSDKSESRRRERTFGSFLRRFTLPEHCDPEKITAVGKNGVLAVTVPKKPVATPKKISVKVD